MDGQALDKFRKICGLLTSEHDGERATAARMATALLKQNGQTWNSISIGLGGDRQSSAVADHSLSQYWQMMCLDERVRNKRLASDVDKLKRQVKTLELKLAEQATGVPVAQQRKAEKAEKATRKAERLAEQQRLAEERAANPRADMPGDAALRDAIGYALAEKIPDRTREFLASVVEQRTWTLKQREAIRKTLQWVFRAQGGET